jgi:hypothetical protein
MMPGRTGKARQPFGYDLPPQEVNAMSPSGKRIGTALLPLPILLFAGQQVRRAYVRTHRYVAPVRIGAFDTRPKSQALIAAAEREDIAEMKRLLDKGVSPDAVNDPRDVEGKTALQIAAGTGNVAVVQLLLDRGADINAPDVWGGTALFCAAISAQPEMVKLLLKRGADANPNDDGATALGFAAHQLGECTDAAGHRGYEEVVRLLQEAGATEAP